MSAERKVSGRRRRTRGAMTPLAALRAHRNSDGILPETTDEELLAWSETLLTPPERPALRLRLRRRTEPLRAPVREVVHGAVSADDILAEIEQRATEAANRLNMRSGRTRR